MRTFYWLPQGSNPRHSSSSLFSGRCKCSHVSPAVVAAVLAPSTRRLPTSGMLLGLFLAASTPPITLPDSPRPVSQKYANFGSDRASVLIGFYYLRSGQACLWPRRISALRGRRLRSCLLVQRMRRCQARSGRKELSNGCWNNVVRGVEGSNLLQVNTLRASSVWL